MTKHGFMMLICASAIALSAGMGAARGSEGDRPGFNDIDLNGDGEISRDEFQAIGAARFQAIDTNGNGQLDRTELEAAASKRAERRAERMLQRLDTNGDGTLSLEEMQARRDPGRVMSRMDTDGNGSISQAEFDAGREKMRQRMADRGTKAPADE